MEFQKRENERAAKLEEQKQEKKRASQGHVAQFNQGTLKRMVWYFVEGGVVL